jgi:hypothetical protein
MELIRKIASHECFMHFSQHDPAQSLAILRSNPQIQEISPIQSKLGEFLIAQEDAALAKEFAEANCAAASSMKASRERSEREKEIHLHLQK